VSLSSIFIEIWSRRSWVLKEVVLEWGNWTGSGYAKPTGNEKLTSKSQIDHVGSRFLGVACMHKSEIKNERKHGR
jgi:hypothetical protein